MAGHCRAGSTRRRAIGQKAISTPKWPRRLLCADLLTSASVSFTACPAGDGLNQTIVGMATANKAQGAITLMAARPRTELPVHKRIRATSKRMLMSRNSFQSQCECERGILNNAGTARVAKFLSRGRSRANVLGHSVETKIRSSGTFLAPPTGWGRSDCLARSDGEVVDGHRESVPRTGRVQNPDGDKLTIWHFASWSLATLRSTAR